MPNVYANLPLPPLNGPGASVNTSTMGRTRTIVVAGSFPGALLTIEASVDGAVTFAPIVSFQDGDEKKVVEVAGEFMRVTVTGRKTSVPFSANLDVASNDDGVMTLSIPLPAGNGVGPAVNASALGTFNTFIAGGSFDGARILVEVSEDGVDYAPCALFAGRGGAVSKAVTAAFYRASVSGRRGGVPFTGTLAVGAVNDPNSGAVVGPGDSTCLVYQPGGPSTGPATFNDWNDLMAQLASFRANANGNGCYTIKFDNAFVAPAAAVIPAGGPYDMTGVTWQGKAQFTQLDPTVNFVQIADGATFANLRAIVRLRLENLNAAVAADSTLGSVPDDLLRVDLGSSIYSSGGQPIWREAAGVPGRVIGFLVQFSNVGVDTPGAVIDITTPGVTLAVDAGYLAVATGTAFTGVVGAGLFLLQFASSTQIASAFPGFAGGVGLGPFGTAVLRPDPFAAAPYVAPTGSPEIGTMIQFDVSGGPVTQTLPPVSAVAVAGLRIGGLVAIKETTGSSGLSIVPAVGDTIDGGPGPVPVPPGGCLVLANNGVSIWRTIAVQDPAGGPETNCLIYQPGGGQVGPVVFDTWAGLMARLAQLRAASNGSGCYTIQFDDDFSSPATIPAGGPYDMSEVTWVGDDRDFLTFAAIADGASFTGLRRFGHNLSVLNLNTVTPACPDLVNGDLVQLMGAATISTTAGGAPFYSAAGMGAGDLALVVLFENAALGSFDTGPVLSFPVAGSFLFVFAEGASAVLAPVLVGAAGTLLQFAVSSLQQYPTTFPNWAGTILDPRLDIPPSLLPQPFLTSPSAAAIAPAFMSEWLRLDASGGAIAQTLPTINAAFNNQRGPGCFLLVTESGGGVLTIAPDAGDTIAGAATAVNVPANGAMLLVSDGVSNWSIVATWGNDRFAPPEQWAQQNVAAGQVAVALSAQVSTNFDTWKAMRRGSVVGLSTRLTEAVTAGTATVRVTVNGVAGTLNVVHTSVLNASGGQSTQQAGIDRFVAGDLIGLSITTNAGFLPITTDLEAWLEAEEEP